MIDYSNPECVFVKILVIMRFAIFCLELVNHKTTNTNNWISHERYIQLYNDTDLITVQHQFELIFNCFISNMPIYGYIMISKTLESCKYLVVHSFQFLQHSGALCSMTKYLITFIWPKYLTISWHLSWHGQLDDY